MKSHLGKIHVYTGDGHGKTTCALGLALRAAGHKYKTIIVQFMKGRKDSGEILVQSHFVPEIEIYQFGHKEFIDKKKPKLEDIKRAEEAFVFAQDILKEKKPDLLILDEINMALDFNLLDLDRVLKFLDEAREKGTEIILTGRRAKKEIIEKADLVTEMKKIKHYYDLGIKARKGIEY